MAEQPAPPLPGPLHGTDIHCLAQPDADTSKNWAHKKFKKYARAVSHKPVVILLPLAWIAIAIGIGIWGLFHATGDDIQLAKGSARYTVEGLLDVFQLNLQKAVVPGIELARAIKQDTNVPRLLANWDALAADIWQQPAPGSLLVRVVHQGQCISVWPHTPSNEAYLGLNSLQDPITRPDLVHAITVHTPTLAGPFNKEHSTTMTINIPIFIPNVSESETFGSDIRPTNCPGDCWNATTRAKWWGTVSIEVDPDEIFEMDEEHEYLSEDFSLQFTREPVDGLGIESVVWSTRGEMCSVNDECAVDTVSLDIEAFNCKFTMLLWKSGGWVPAYFKPLIAMVVVVSLLVAVLIFLGMVAWSEHHAMIHCLLPDNAVERLRKNVWDENLSVHVNNLQQGTPANHMLEMLKQMQAGVMPGMRQIITVQQALHKGRDVYQPLAEEVGERMQAAEYMDKEVRNALMRQLVGGDAFMETRSDDDSLPSKINEKEGGGRGRARSGVWSSNVAYSEDIGIETLDEAEMGTLDHMALEIHGGTLGTVDENEQICSPTKSHARVLTCNTCKMTANTTLQAWAEQLVGTDVFPSLADAVGHLMRPECQTAVSESGHTDDHGHHSDSDSSTSVGHEPSGDFATLELAKSHSHIIEAASDSVQYSGWARSSAGRRTASVCRVPTARIDRVLAKAAKWGFDAFKLDEVTHGHSLSVLGFWVLHKSRLIRDLGLHEVRLARFLRAVEAAYPDNPYHNRKHATDVLQKMFVLLTSGGVGAGYTDKLTSLACYLAAIVHDVEHVGRTNDYLVNTQHPLAIRYNDRSPMENHHLAAAWQLLRKPDQNFLAGLPAAECSKLRKLAIELVLATDMKSHFAIVGQFQAQHANITPGQPSGGSVSPANDSSSVLYKLHRNWSGSDSQHSMIGPVDPIVPLSETERLLGLQMALKCCDLGHLAAPLAVHLKWVSSLEAEFFLQGDVERSQGLAISPLCDRNKEGVTKSQVGFFDFVVLPLVSLFVGRFTRARPLLKAVTANYNYWAKTKASMDKDSQSRRATDTPLHSVSVTHKDS